MLARQAATAASVGTCWPWETVATLPSTRRRKAQGAHRGGEGRGYIAAAARLQLEFGYYVHVLHVNLYDNIILININSDIDMIFDLGLKPKGFAWVLWQQ